MLALLGVNARAAGEVPVPDYVRLHVVAADDSSEAQALKLQVRDAVLVEARAMLADCGGADEAWQAACAGLDRLSAAAVSAARAGGYAGPVRCVTGVFAFPDRRYGATVVPAGDYRALRVVIGPGQGHNWWCVLYPSLCYPEDVDPTESVRFHSTILAWLRRLFGGEDE